MRKFDLLCVCVLSLFIFTACNQDEIFSRFHSFPDSKWHKNNPGVFEVDITDTINHYQVMLEIRNNDDYPFRNIWFFVDVQSPDSLLRTDTINIDLADVYGKWYGKGLGIYSLPVSFEENKHYPRSGKYIYSIKQGMREDPLTGISDIGLIISKKGKQ